MTSMMPCVRELSLEPGRVLPALAGLPHAFLLHSALPGAHGGWSFFGADPFAVCRGDDGAAAATLWRGTRRHVPAAGRVAPFQGGVVGYWAYELAAPGRREADLPLLVAGAYDVVGAIEHATGRAWLVSTGLPDHGPAAAGRARRRLEAFAARLAAPPSPPGCVVPGPAMVTCSMTADAFRAAVRTVQAHIRAGDIFQANLTQRWTAAHGDTRTTRFAHALAERVAARSPAPFAAFLDAGDHAVVSASPERFLALRGGSVEARPIKGTRPRDPDPTTDRALAAALSASAKDRAENVMIVDVLRNDIGRVCRFGSVEVPELCTLEAYPQVWHLTSAVTGALRADRDAFDLLEACFPGGSITGAPKIRAMEILAGLEPVPRHVYTGAIGYVDWNGDADWNIAIRTALVTPGAVRFAAGGGITADSDPDAEYEETLHKAEGLRAALSDLLGPLELRPAAALQR